MPKNDMEKMVKRWRKQVTLLSQAAKENDKKEFLRLCANLRQSVDAMECRMYTEESEGAVQASLFS